MNQAVLVINAGSSSLKFSVYQVEDTLKLRSKGQIEGIGTAPHFVANGAAGDLLHEERWEGGNHGTALGQLHQWLGEHLSGETLLAVGHRVVHGGSNYSRPVRITPEVLQRLEDFVPLAPLHQPHNLSGIHALADNDPNLPQVACFDTAFHRSHPRMADIFALPLSLYDEGVRRYGFHGLSYEYIAQALPKVAPEIADGKVVVCHLGSGASMCAIEKGRSIDSTMGFTALDGLPMGTRCGNIDPGVLLYLMQQHGMDAAQIEGLLYKNSGLKGLSGISNDMRDLQESDDPRAHGAIEYFIYRISRELGALSAALNGLDGIVFTAGIGERSAEVRARVCRAARWLGVVLDEDANRQHRSRISIPQSKVSAWVIPTDEELMIARHTVALMG